MYLKTLFTDCITDLDNTNLEYMLFEKQQVVAAGLRSSGTSLNIEPTPKMTLYDALPTYSRSVSVVRINKHLIYETFKIQLNQVYISWGLEFQYFPQVIKDR